MSNSSLKPRRLLLLWLSLAALSLAVGGCASAPAPKPRPVKKTVSVPDAPPVPDSAEIVLENGMVVTASTPAGKITVAGGPGLLRTIKWDGAKRYVVTRARSERVYGAKGVYFKGAPDGWKAYNGLSRVEYEEGKRFFDNASDASIWMQIRRLHYVHTNDGLVVGWKRKPNEATLQVEVWQFFINDEKPSLLPDARDYLIQVRQAPLRTSGR